MKNTFFFSLFFLALSACSKTKTATAGTAAKSDPKDPSAAMRAAGVDFLCSGTEPFWSLKLDFDQVMRFENSEGQFVKTPITPARMEDGALVYESHSGANRLKVSIKKEACSDGMSDQKYDYSVSVTVKDNTYQGCGRRLQSSPGAYWILQSVSGKPTAAAAYTHGLPVLQLNFQDKTYAGSDGCNTLRGKLTGGADGKVKFDTPVSTRMACPGEAPDQFQVALLSADSWKIKNDRLTLYKGKTALLVFDQY